MLTPPSHPQHRSEIFSTTTHLDLELPPKKRRRRKKTTYEPLCELEANFILFMWTKVMHHPVLLIVRSHLRSMCASWCVMAQDDSNNWKEYTYKSLHFICMSLSFADRVSSICIWKAVSEMKNGMQNNPPTLSLATDWEWENKIGISHRQPNPLNECTQSSENIIMFDATAL